MFLEGLRHNLKAHSGMRKFLTAESRLNLMKCFCFTLKTLLIFICRDFVGHLQKWLDKKSKVNFKILNVKNWETNNYSTNIVQYLKK